jgi:HD-like signal output (HDOD) protein
MSNQQTLTQRINAVLASLTADIKNNKLEIPSPPDLLIKVRMTAANPDSSAEDILNLVKHDLNISARLVKVANCALFGKRFHVNSVKSAIARLGLARVQSLIIGLSIAQNMMRTKTKGLDAFFNKTWKQSNYVASICYVLALRKTNIDPEKALLAGMIHNLGVIPLMLRLYNVDELKAHPKVLEKVAGVVLPKLYPAAGKLIMKSWNFSPDIVRIADTHRQLDREDTSSEIELDDLALIAHQLSQLNDFTDADETPLALVETKAFKKLWISWSAATLELQELQTEIDQIQYEMTH